MVKIASRLINFVCEKVFEDAIEYLITIVFGAVSIAGSIVLFSDIANMACSYPLPLTVFAFFVYSLGLATVIIIQKVSAYRGALAKRKEIVRTVRESSIYDKKQLVRVLDGEPYLIEQIGLEEPYGFFGLEELVYPEPVADGTLWRLERHARKTLTKHPELLEHARSLVKKEDEAERRERLHEIFYTPENFILKLGGDAALLLAKMIENGGSLHKEDCESHPEGLKELVDNNFVEPAWDEERILRAFYVDPDVLDTLKDSTHELYLHASCLM